MTSDIQDFYSLAVALAIGLLIGIERGWQERGADEGSRVAGVRTYGLFGLFGGTVGLLGERYGAGIIAMALLSLSLVLTGVYIANSRNRKHVGITSLMAGLMTAALGVLAGVGEIPLAVAFAVITVVLLDYKPVLHRWVLSLESQELRATIKLLLISVVMLPVLPNQGYGPWGVLNPYQIWWMVVLVATISFIGYFAIKIGGARRGAIFTGLFGGLASSTALTLHFSRLGRTDTAITPLLATGILIACGTMYLRMLLVASIINPELLQSLIVPACVMALMVYIPALWYWLRSLKQPTEISTGINNPLDIKTALLFGLFLALVMLLGKALQEWSGASGVLALAAASGVADVDAITLSLSDMSNHDLPLNLAVSGITIAAAVNSLVKAVMAFIAGGSKMGVRVGIPLLATALGGFLAAWVLYFMT